MNDTTLPAADTASQPLKVKITGMDCGSCAMTIENSIAKLPGVEAAAVSFTTESMEVKGDVSLDAIEARLQELGYKLASNTDAVVKPPQQHHGFNGFVQFLWQQPPLRMALLVTAVVLASLLLLPSTPWLGELSALDMVFAMAVLVAGAPVFLKGFRALLFARRITIDLLMAVASVGALGIGEYGEAVTVILLFMLGEALEAYSAERARDSLRSLLALQPQEATVLQSHTDSHDHGDAHDHDHHHEDAHGHDHIHDHNDTHEHAHDHSQCDGQHHAKQPAHDHAVLMAVDKVQPGDRVLVRPGQRIPVDGVVIKGISSVNQAPVTGENMPVLKQTDDDVMAGTVNGEAALEIRTTRPAAEGTIARIARLVEQAQSQRSPAERFIDRFARWYTPAVVILAALVVAIPVLLFGQPLMNQAGGETGWLYRGLAMLIIACPCALVISIPVTVVSGLTRLANLGVLVKSGAHLDRLADIAVIAFDKTGTLTHGRPTVASIHTTDCAHPANSDDCGACDNVVSIAAAIERASEHPVAHAILSAAKQRKGVGHLPMADAVQAHPGRGVSGEIQGGRQVVVGTGELFKPSMAGWQQVSGQADLARQAGDTVMYVGSDDRVLGYIGVQDEVRDNSRAALDELAALGIRKVMLTGDHQQAANRVAEVLGGIDEVQAELLPEQKLQAIETLHQRYGAVAMVGDGINDAPALARADIGIAMGAGGTAQAMETADVVLMQDDLNDVARALRLARASRQIIKQNIVLSLALKFAFLGLAIPGLATLWMAVLADVGATLLVTMNGMRLLRKS